MNVLLIDINNFVFFVRPHERNEFTSLFVRVITFQILFLIFRLDRERNGQREEEKNINKVKRHF